VTRAPGADRPVGQEAAQVLGDLLRRRVALGRVLRHALEHHGFQVARHARVEAARGDDRLVQHLLDQPGLVRIVEGRPER
jgi:hypothetical protein